MLLFNAFQIVCLFAAMPFIVAWLRSATFSGAFAASWIAVVVYAVMFCLMVYNTYFIIEQEFKK